MTKNKTRQYVEIKRRRFDFPKFLSFLAFTMISLLLLELFFRLNEGRGGFIVTTFCLACAIYFLVRSFPKKTQKIYVQEGSEE